MRTRRLVLLGGGLFAVAAATLSVMGCVVLLDPYRQVASAQLIDGWGRKQPLLNLVFLRVVVPKADGAVMVTCSNGRVIGGGYVTPGMPRWQTVGDTFGCSSRRP